MRIERIEIYDIKGTASAVLKRGDLWVIGGENGSGKSSIVDGIKSVFEGGHDPALLRRGAKKGQIIITLDSGTTITKTVTARASTVEIVDRAGNVIKAPQSFINDLAEGLSVDPARLLLAKPKDLVAVLLEVISLEFTPEEIFSCFGRIAEPPQIGGVLDLEGLGAVRQQLYDQRKAHNQKARDAEGYVRQLRTSMPDEDGKDWSAEVSRLQALREAGLQEIQKAKGIAETRCAEVEREINSEIDGKIRDLERERGDRIAAARHARDTGIAAVDAASRPDLDRITAELATARERLANKDRAAGAKQLLADMQAKVAGHGAEAEKLTLAIEAVDALKKLKVDALPIPGIEISGDQVLVDGVPWQHVNTAKRVEIAFQICALRAGRLPFMVIDDAEHFDSETWSAFKDVALQSGFQVVAARVGNGPLRIDTVHAEQPTLV